MSITPENQEINASVSMAMPLKTETIPSQMETIPLKKEIILPVEPLETETALPAGYMMDRKERLIPVSNVDEYDKLIDELVLSLVADSKTYREQLMAFKKKTLDDCDTFMALLAEKYDRKPGGNKGNVTFSSFDGSKKVMLQIHDSILFGPELMIAKGIIDELLSEWTEGANHNLQALITDAFQVDKAGNISTSRILSLRRIKIGDQRWLNAMNAISESILISTSKRYLRFYEKDSAGEMQAVSLDFAKL